MKCKICGSELKPGDTTCHVCGVVVDYHSYVDDSFSSAEDKIKDFSSSPTSPKTSLPSKNEKTSFFNTPSNNKPTTSSSADDNDKTKYLIAAIIAVILLIGFGVVLVKILTPEPKTVPDDEGGIILGGDEGKKPSEPSLPSTPEEPEEPEDPEVPEDPEDPVNPENPEDPEDPITPPEVKPKTKSFEGYLFPFIDGYTIKQEQESLIYENQTDNVEFVLSIYHSNPYATYVKRKDEVKAQWEERDYVITEYGEQTIGSNNWLIFNTMYGTSPFSIVYRPFFNNSTIELLILNNGTLSSNEIYSQIENMLSSTSIDSETTTTGSTA